MQKLLVLLKNYREQDGQAKQIEIAFCVFASNYVKGTFNNK